MRDRRSKITGEPRTSVRAEPRVAKALAVPGSRTVSARAFTLVEMIVVVAIILIVVGISLPSVTSMWDNQKVTEAENKIQGLLMTTRSRSVSSAEGEHGILIYLDEQGAQRMVPIARAKVPADVPILQADAHRLAYIDVFTVQDARQTVLPKPLRVVPRNVVIPDAENDDEKSLTFSDQELVRDSWSTPPAQGFNQAQRHRNYFALVFSADGQLMDRRNVLIQDFDAFGGQDDRPDGRGDLTGLPSSYDHTNDVPLADKYYDKSDDMAKPLDPTGSFPVVKVPFLVVEAAGAGASARQQEIAINFPTADGMLLYDDDQFQEIAGPNGENAPEARRFLLKSARPLYVNRKTGALVRGPVGEGDQVESQ